MSKKIAFFGILTAFLMVLGYIESLFPLSFIAPGIKLGLSNSAVLLLIDFGKRKEAVIINTARILLSALIFGSVSALPFSLLGAIGSMAVMTALSNLKCISIVGKSIAGGTVHNLFQGIAAILLMGNSLIYYFPVLVIFGALSGGIIGFSAILIKKRLNFILKK